MFKKLLFCTAFTLASLAYAEEIQPEPAGEKRFAEFFAEEFGGGHDELVMWRHNAYEKIAEVCIKKFDSEQCKKEIYAVHRSWLERVEKCKNCADPQTCTDNECKNYALLRILIKRAITEKSLKSMNETIEKALNTTRTD